MEAYAENLIAVVADAENRKREEIEQFNQSKKQNAPTEKTGSGAPGFAKLEPWEDCQMEENNFDQPIIDTSRVSLLESFKPSQKAWFRGLAAKLSGNPEEKPAIGQKRHHDEVEEGECID